MLNRNNWAALLMCCLLSTSPIVWAQMPVPSANSVDLRRAAHMVMQIEDELGWIDSSQRHLMVARLNFLLDRRQIGIDQDFPTRWLEWQRRLDVLEGPENRLLISAWHEPIAPDAAALRASAIVPAQRQLAGNLSGDLMAQFLAETLLDGEPEAFSDPAQTGLLGWAYIRAYASWYELLKRLDAAPELVPLVAPLVNPWLGLPVDAELSQWTSLRPDDAQAIKRALAQADDLPGVVALERAFESRFDVQSVNQGGQVPGLHQARLVLVTKRAEATQLDKALIGLAAQIGQLEAGQYALWLQALTGFVRDALNEPREADSKEYIEAVLAALAKTDSFLPEMLSSVDPRLLSAHQGLRRLMRDRLEQGVLRDVARQRAMLELAEISAALGLDSYSLDEYLNAEIRQRYVIESAACIDLSLTQPFYPPVALEERQFLRCVDALIDWGVRDATLAELSGSRDGPFELVNLQRELGLHAWQRFNYWLGWMASQSDAACFPETALPNPLEWALAARTVRWFADRWPAYAAGGQFKQKLDQMIQMGQAINLVRTNAGSCQSSGETAALTPLQQALVNYSREKVSLADSLASAQQRFRMENLALGADIDLNQGIEQESHFAPAETMIGPCSQRTACGASVTLEASKALFDLFPDQFLLAHQLGLGDVSICYDNVRWFDRRAEAPPVRIKAMASYFGKLSFDLVGKYSGYGRPVFRMGLAGQQEVEYLFGANTEEVLNDDCPVERLNKQVTAELPERIINLVPRRLTFLTAGRTAPETLLAAHWSEGEQWRDKFVTQVGVEIMERNDPSFLRTELEEALLSKRGSFRNQMYRAMLQRLSPIETSPNADVTAAMDALVVYRGGLQALGKILGGRDLANDPELRQLLYGQSGLFGRDMLVRRQSENLSIASLLALLRNTNGQAEQQIYAWAGTLPAPEPLIDNALLDLMELRHRLNHAVAVSQ